MAAERLSCLARNGRSPGEESLATAIAAQAIEAQPSFGQIEPSGAAWFAGSDSYSRRTRGGYRAIRTRGRVHRAKKKKPLRRDGRLSCCRPNGRQRARIMVGIGSTEVAAWLAVKGCTKSATDQDSTPGFASGHSQQGMAPQSPWSAPSAR